MAGTRYLSGRGAGTNRAAWASHRNIGIDLCVPDGHARPVLIGQGSHSPVPRCDSSLERADTSSRFLSAAPMIGANGGRPWNFVEG